MKGRTVLPRPTVDFVTVTNLLSGAFAFAFPVLLAFLPDEQLVRLKLEALEILTFGWLILVGVTVAFRVSPSGRRRPSGLTSAVAVWVGVTGALWCISAEKSLANMELRRVLLAAGLFMCASRSRLGPVGRRALLVSWVVSSAVMAFYGILQRTGGMAHIDVPRMDRPIGTFGNPIFFAAFLSVSLFMTLAAFSAVKNGWARFAALVALPLQASALYFTQTRAAWLAVAAAAIAGIGWQVRGKRALMLLGLVGAGGVAFLSATKSVWSRDQAHALIWRDTARMWAAHPVMGVGLGAFHTNFPQAAQDDLKAKWPQGRVIVNNAHNEYLQILAEGGVLLFLAFGVVIVGFFVSASRLLARAGPHAAPVLFLTLGAVALLVQNLFSVDMRFSISFGVLFLIMGLVDAEAGLREAQPAKAQATPGPSSQFSFPRLAGSLVWTGFLIVAVWPALIHPYRAQKEVKSQKDFFDERLLDPAKTISDLEALAGRYPGEFLVWERLAYAYAKEIKARDGKINASRARQASEAYMRVAELKPDYANAFNNLGNIYFTVGLTEKALATWEKAVQLNPDLIAVHLNLGKVLYTKGRLKESAAHFEAVVRRDPGNAEAVVYLKKMVE